MEWFDKNATAIIAAGAALLSALIAGGFAIFGAWLNNRQNDQRLKLQFDHEKTKESKKLFLDKGEELYVCVDKWISKGLAQLVSGHKLISGTVTPEQRATMLEKYVDAENNLRLQTLMTIYFTNLIPLKMMCDEGLRISEAAINSRDEGRTSVIAITNEFEKGRAAFEDSSDKLILALQMSLMEQVNN